MQYQCWFKDNPSAKREIDASWVDMAAELFCYEEEGQDAGIIEDKSVTVVVQAPDGAKWKMTMRGKWTLRFNVEDVVRLGDFMNTITIIIKNGIVQDVQGLPDDYQYQVADFDFSEKCNCQEQEPFTWDGKTICLSCYGEIEEAK